MSAPDGDDVVNPPLSVLRICSVFEPPDAVLTGRGARFDPVGGMQSHTGQLTRALDRRGVRHAVITHRPPGAPRRHRIGDHAIVHRFGLPVARARQFYSARAAAAALRLARGADIVHAHLGEDLAILPIAFAAARRAHLPLVITVHCSLRHTYRGRGVRGVVLARLGGTLETAICRRANAVIVLTPRLAGHLTRHGLGADRVHVIPSGVDPAAGTGDPPDPFPGVPRPRIAYVGRLTRSKGVHTLVRAAPRLRTDGAQLLLVGDGPARGSLERRIRRSGVADRVHITGFLPHRDIAAVLRHADAVCVPSLYEELGTVVLEAMQAGLPIVASDTGGIPWAVGPAARLVPPADADALAAALDAVLTEAEAAARLGRLARERAEGLSWERLVHRVLDVYRLALAGPADSPTRPEPAAEERAIAAR